MTHLEIEPGLGSGSPDSCSREKKKRRKRTFTECLLYAVINWNLLFRETTCMYYVGYYGLYLTALPENEKLDE